MIAGSPAGVHAAATALGGAGTAFDEAGTEVGQHGESTTASWYGRASDAAGEAIHALKTSTLSVADAVSSCERVYATYADELAAAQAAWLTGQEQQTAGEAGQRAAADAVLAADSRGADDLGRAPALDAARSASEQAGLTAAQGRTAMADAVAREARANEAAATAVDAIVELLQGVAASHPIAVGPMFGPPVPMVFGPPSPSGPTLQPGVVVDDGGPAVLRAQGAMGLSALPGPGDPERPTSVPPGDDAAELGTWWHDLWLGKTPEDEAGNRHSPTYNQVGGLGNGFWNAVPGAAGRLLAGSPYGWVRAGNGPIVRAHDRLGSWYGADTGSRAYGESSETGEIAGGVAIPLPVGKGRALEGLAEGVARKSVLHDFPAPPTGPASSTWGIQGTLEKHVQKHGSDFGTMDPQKYASEASALRQRVDDPRVQVKVEKNLQKGDVIRVYDPKTNTFGSYNADGTSKTLYKPPAGQDYFDRQPGSIR